MRCLVEMFQVALLNIRRFVRSPLLFVSLLALVLITVFVLFLPAVSEQARARLSLEAFFFLVTLFLAFVGALAASRTLSVDRRRRLLPLVSTRVGSSTLVVGTFMGMGTVVLTLSLLAFLLARLILPVGDMRLKRLLVADEVADTGTLYRGVRYALQLTPSGNPLLNTVEAARIVVDTEEKMRRKRLLYLNDDNPQVLWFFDVSTPVRGIILSAVVLHTDKTKAHLCVLHNGRTILDEDIVVKNETSMEIPLNGITGRVVVAVSLLPEGEPLAFRLWLDEAGYERTGVMLLTKETGVTSGVFICSLITALKAMTLVAFGIFCASFLSPAVASIFATFLFFLASANRFILQSATVLPSPHETAQPDAFYASVRAIIEVVCYITPKLTLYSPEAVVSRGFSVGTHLPLSSLLHFAVYIPPLLLLSSIVHGPVLRMGEEGD